MTTLLLLVCFVADDARTAAIAAAKVRYSKLLADTERQQIEGSVTRERRRVSEFRRSEIVPGLGGDTAVMRDRGDGVFVQVARQFPSVEARERAVALATNDLAKAEATLEKWKAGEYRPVVEVPPLDPRRLSVGAVGRLSKALVLSSEQKGAVVLLETIHGQSNKPALLKDPRFPNLANDKTYALRGVYWVSGSVVIRKQTMYVVEPLDVD